MVIMNNYILLLRGVNVGGTGLLPMKELSAMLEAMGYEDVRTYIQSGNVVFRSKKTLTSKAANEISKTIKKKKSFEPKAMILIEQELLAAIKANPFDVDAGKALHLFFLDSPSIKPDIALLESVKSSTEQYKLIKKVFYLYAPDGVGKSKLATKVEKALGVSTTARNWNTVSKLAEMIRHPLAPSLIRSIR
jgi:uncharacterized protein (DUF1697 family)